MILILISTQKNKKDYKKKILNFDKINLKINKNEIYKFYFARHIFLDVNWLIPNYKKFINSIGGLITSLTLICINIGFLIVIKKELLIELTLQ